MDIHCRVCGEPYSCVGGLQPSRTDLTWWEFHQFIRGLGCPCCLGAPRSTDDAQTNPEWPNRREELDRQWMTALAAATDEVTPFADFDKVASEPVQFYQYSVDEPSIEKRLYDGPEAHYTALQKLDSVSKGGKAKLSYDGENAVGHMRSWSFAIDPTVVYDVDSRGPARARANMAAFEAMAGKKGVIYDVGDSHGAIYVHVVVEDSRTGQLAVREDAVALCVAIGQFKRGDVIDEGLYEEMCEKEYEELEDEARVELASELVKIFDCSEALAIRWLKDIDLFYRGDDDSLGRLTVDAKLNLVELKLDFARHHGLTGWLFVKSRDEYGCTYAVIGGVTTNYSQPEGVATFHAVASYDRHGLRLGAGERSFHEFSWSKIYREVFNSVPLKRVPDRVLQAFLEDLESEF